MYSNIKNFFYNYSQLTDEEWSVLEAKLKVETVKKKTRLTEINKICRRVYYIEKGALRLYYYKDGEEVCGNFFFEDELAGSFESFIKQIPGYQIIESLEDSLLFSFSFEDIQFLFNKYPIYNRVFMNILNESFIKIQKLISLYILTDPLERYLHLIEHYPSIVQRVPQKHIASFLGITQFSLSRIKARLAKM